MKTTPHDRQSLPAARGIVAVLVIVSLVALSLTYAFTLHLHVLPGGRVVVHSHPVGDDDRKETHHQHSAQDYAFYNGLSKSLVSDTPTLVWCDLLFDTPSSFVDHREESADAFLATASAHMRSPPTITLLV